MELWIRSQDRECLMKVDRLDYDLSNYKHRIMVNGYQTLVAEYETKKRALEVLDEIQKLIKPKTLINMENFNTNDARVLCDKFKEYSPIIVGNDNIKIEPLSFIVYEMPKE